MKSRGSTQNNSVGAHMSPLPDRPGIQIICHPNPRPNQ